MLWVIWACYITWDFMICEGSVVKIQEVHIKFNLVLTFECSLIAFEVLFPCWSLPVWLHIYLLSFVLLLSALDHKELVQQWHWKLSCRKPSGRFGVGNNDQVFSSLFVFTNMISHLSWCILNFHISVWYMYIWRLIVCGNICLIRREKKEKSPESNSHVWHKK